ncbi:MAG TPA: alpha/beta hydrolase-fold protein [Gemmatimonadaceae bacterium]|nr:alpha/beta hydrolase-fold protein [Gemmatimonadaceae bacterium]
MRTLLRTSVLLLGAATASAQPARAPVSSEITALRDAVARKATGAESHFWARIQRDGAPLVELIPGDSANVLVTFVWHGDSATKNVALVNTAVASYAPAEALLARIPGTNVWYRSYPARADARFVYELSVNDNLVPFDQVTDWGARTATFRRDPFNTRVFEAAIFGRGQSYAEGPRAPREEWIAERPGVAKGSVEKTTFTSKLLGTARDVWIYTPPGYDSLSRRTDGLPLLLTFDGGEYVSSIPGPTILDNLIAARRIAPMIGVFVGSAEGQRDVELGTNAQYVEFLATELLPWIREKHRLAASPRGNVVAGSSLGGLAAAFVAYRHPELFGNVLSQSGAFMYGSPGGAATEALTREIEASPRRDVAFHLEAGIYEEVRLENGIDLLTSNRHLRDVLRAKGYRLTYDEFAGGHSDLNWRSGFARGMLALVGR